MEVLVTTVLYFKYFCGRMSTQTLWVTYSINIFVRQMFTQNDVVTFPGVIINSYVIP